MFFCPNFPSFSRIISSANPSASTINIYPEKNKSMKYLLQHFFVCFPFKTWDKSHLHSMQGIFSIFKPIYAEFPVHYTHFICIIKIYLYSLGNIQLPDELNARRWCCSLIFLASRYFIDQFIWGGFCLGQHSKPIAFCLDCLQPDLWIEFISMSEMRIGIRIETAKMKVSNGFAFSLVHCYKIL